jgi:Ca2+-binding RTX toxin-like protein
MATVTNFEVSGVLHDGAHGEEPVNTTTQTFTATNGVEQIHTFLGDANTELVLGFTGITKFSHGHHARSGGGNDKFHFKNLDQVKSLIVGRLEDVDFSRDQIVIENVVLDLNKLPQNVRVVQFNGSHNDVGAEPQQWLSIKTNGGEIFYALEGARIDMTGNGGANNGDQEAHFITTPVDTSKLKSVSFIDPMNTVPKHFTADGGVIINDEDVTKADVLEYIRGGDLGDLIAGGLNNDTVLAGAGNDRVWGGSGNDVVYGDSLFAGEGDDRIQGDVGNDLIYGGTGSDVLMGGDGNDRIFGGDGNDSLYGGDGLDTIIGENGDDIIFGYQGSDSIDGSAGNDYIKGGEGSDLLIGAEGDDTLNGQTGDDAVVGGNGSDRIYGDFGRDYLKGDAGDDFLFGGSENDTLKGGTGNDVLGGGNGSDLLIGGQGADQLTGGFGADRFVFNERADSGLNASDRDVINDFQRGLDKIDVSAMDAHAGMRGDQSFSFVGSARFNDADDRGDLRVVAYSRGVEVLIDVDGNGTSDMSILVAGVTSLSINDFIL